jgi:hypothetical protein
MSKEKKAFKDTTFGKILGKAGDLVGDVPGIVLKATVGGDPMGAIQDTIKTLSGSKDPKAKEIITELDLKMAEMELEFSKVELEETKAYLGDVQNARNREIELAKSGVRNWFQTVVGFFGITMLAFCLYVLVYENIPGENKELFIHFLGIIEGVAISIFGYYYGSSKSSSDKTDMMTTK